MPRVTMVFGLLAAGKTTLSRQLEDGGAVRLTADEWEIALSGNRHHLDFELHQRVVGQLMSLWPELVRAGVDVVLDFGFWERDLRDEVRATAAARNADVELVWVQCNDDERRRRCLGRSASSPPDAYAIDSEAFTWIETNRVIDYPTEDETFRVVDTSP